jgi:hypothetical protein
MFTAVALVHDLRVFFAIRALHSITYYIGVESLHSNYNTLWMELSQTTTDCVEYTLATVVLKEFVFCKIYFDRILSRFELIRIKLSIGNGGFLGRFDELG